MAASLDPTFKVYFFEKKTKKQKQKKTIFFLNNPLNHLPKKNKMKVTIKRNYSKYTRKMFFDERKLYKKPTKTKTKRKQTKMHSKKKKKKKRKTRRNECHFKTQQI